jgi:fatty-acyl-CoA synthase
MVETLQEALVRAADHGESEGLRFLDRHENETRVSWPEVHTRAQRTAGGLKSHGVRAGDCVALVLPTGPEFFDAFFGTLLLGAVPVPLYPPVRLGRLAEYHARTTAMLRAVDAKILVTDAKLWRILGESVEAARLPLGAVRVSELDGPPPLAAWHPDDLALVQFSSGTTVDPKPVALTHRNVLANTRAIVSRLLEVVHDAEKIGVSWLPLYHDMGLIGCVFPAMLYPGSLLLLGPELFIARPALWLRALSRTRASVSTAPNFAYGLCTERITDEEMEGVDLSGWRLALNGAEPVSAHTLRRFVDRFARWGLRPEALTPVYGLAEASLAVTFADTGTPFRTERFDRHALSYGRVVPDADGVELTSVGRPLEGIELDVPVDVVGPVRVRAPSVMHGYLHRPAQTAEAIEDGWLTTGDLGFLHDGELFLTGREKDVVILRGSNHSPHEIEHALDAVPGVRTGCSAAASWRPDHADSEQLVVFVERRADADDTLADRCKDAVLRATGLAAAHVVLLAPGTLPRTSSGKIRRGETLRRWLAEELLPPDKVDAWMIAGALARGTVAHWRARLS